MKTRITELDILFGKRIELERIEEHMLRLRSAMIEKVSYMPAIELFARQNAPGWDCWGNEAVQ